MSLSVFLSGVDEKLGEGEELTQDGRTRCRYSRVSRIRKLLGCANPPLAPNAAQYAVDEDYLEVQITTSWIGGPAAKDQARGAVLAFFHAATGACPRAQRLEEEADSWMGRTRHRRVSGQ